nr:hypothetical protein [Actinospica acidithermotolerans]
MTRSLEQVRGKIRITRVLRAIRLVDLILEGLVDDQIEGDRPAVLLRADQAAAFANGAANQRDPEVADRTNTSSPTTTDHTQIDVPGVTPSSRYGATWKSSVAAMLARASGVQVDKVVTPIPEATVGVGSALWHHGASGTSLR